MVVICDQGAIAGKNYWVGVQTANALSPPAEDIPIKKNDAGRGDRLLARTSGSRTDVICGIYPLGNKAYPGAQTCLNCQPSDQSRTHSICPLEIWIVLYKVALYAVWRLQVSRTSALALPSGE